MSLWNGTATEMLQGHHAASGAEPWQALKTRDQMPGGLPNRDSCAGLAEPRIVDDYMSNPEILGADDVQL